MSKKDELEKLEEEIKLKELKLKEQELNQKLGSNNKKHWLLEFISPSEENKKKYWILRQPWYIRIPVQIIFWIFVLWFFLWIIFREEGNSSTSSSPTIENSEISKTYSGCDGLDELIDDGLFMSDSLAIMQIQSQINMMSDQQCQGLIDKNNSVRESR